MLGGGIVNSVSDLLITVLPIPIVMKLQMPLRQRVGVCILLCLGLIVTIAGSLRTYFTWRSLIESWDETWFAYPLWIAAAVEIDLGLVSRPDMPKMMQLTSDTLHQDMLLRPSMEDAPAKAHQRPLRQTILLPITKPYTKHFRSSEAIYLRSLEKPSVVPAHKVRFRTDAARQRGRSRAA